MMTDKDSNASWKENTHRLSVKRVQMGFVASNQNTGILYPVEGELLIASMKLNIKMK